MSIRAVERALLGGMMLEPIRIADVAHLREDQFELPTHAKLFDLLTKMFAAGEAIDLVTVPMAITSQGNQDQYGGVAYVIGLPDLIPSTANLRHYANLIEDDWVRRHAKWQLEEAKEKLLDTTIPGVELVESLATALLGVKGAGGQGWTGAHELAGTLEKELIEFTELPADRRKQRGLKTGFISLDNRMTGMHSGDLIVIAARPGMGKTALVAGIANRCSKGHGGNKSMGPKDPTVVGFFSLEMPKESIVNRMVCERGRVSASIFRTGNALNSHERQGLEFGRMWVENCSVFIDDQAGLTPSQIVARARKLHAVSKDGVGLIIVDYLQLIAAEDKRMPREQHISMCSRMLKQLAKDLGCPVIALSQLNRAVEQRPDKRPMISDLRESGAIEQDADTIMFIYRDDYYNPDDSDYPGVAEIIIAKQRSGSTGICRLKWTGNCTRFDDLAAEPS